MGSFWKWRTRHAIGNVAAPTSSEENSPNESTRICNLGSYKPRSSSGGLSSVGKSVRKKRYSDSVLLHMHEVAVSLELERKQRIAPTKQQQNNMTLLQRFGYDIYTQQFPDPCFSSRTRQVTSSIRFRTVYSVLTVLQLVYQRLTMEHYLPATHFRQNLLL